eukprot:13574622-Ditylum_brightwellii.AAC.1
MPTIETVETCHDKAATTTCSKHLTINLLSVNEGDKTSEEVFNREGDGHYGNASITATSMAVTVMATGMTVTGMTVTVTGMTAHISCLVL